jgi:shikimate dehydrogenase
MYVMYVDRVRRVVHHPNMSSQTGAHPSLQTLRCGIVLHPASHTRSPAMHRAAYAALGLDAEYEVFDVPPAELPSAMKAFRARGLRQLAVSIPHKESMLDLVDEIESVAREIGAINTVTRVGDRLVGTNTDWIGALRALERATTIEGRCAVVLGAGGTARALVYGLRERGADVHVLNRTIGRAEALVREFGVASAGALEDLRNLNPDILVNTTSVGLNEDRSPIAAEAIREGLVVLDAVYSPERTRLLEDATARGGRAIGGKWMLVHQAIEQLRQWTAYLENPPTDEVLDGLVDIMARAFDEAGRGE